MRILWVKAGRLLPVDTGGKIRSFNILKHLAGWNDATLLSYYQGPRDQQYQRELARLFPGAIAVPARLPEKASLRGRVDYVRSFFSPLPYAVYKHTNGDVRGRVRRLLASGHFDVAVCDFLAPAANFDRDSQTPVVLFEHNVEAVLWQRQAAHQKNAAASIVYRLEAAKMLRYEKSAIRRFDRVVAVSEKDADWFRAIAGSPMVSVVPTGVDTDQYRQERRGDDAAELHKDLIVFLGSMDWEANVDGVVHFCGAILPLIREQIPAARLRIVGRDPGAAIRRLASATVEVTGTVESVVPHLRQAAVVVVPLRIGGGTRLKILEAMAMGKAIVSTSIGAEGLNLEDGREIILADGPCDFAAAVARLMQNDRERLRLEDNAAALARRHGWENSASIFHQVLFKVVNEKRPNDARSIAREIRWT